MHAYWDEHVELQARTVDALNRVSYYLLRVNGNEPSEPAPITRPGPAPEPETISLAQFGAMTRGPQ